MATFPGDMSINWGFGLQEEPSDMYAEDRAKEQALEQEAETAYYGRGFDQQDEPQPTDPLLAVSELEQRVESLEGQVNQLGEELTRYRSVLSAKSERITDLEERLRSLTLVVNTLAVCNENLERVVKDVLIASIGNKEWKQSILTIVQKRIEKE